MGMNSNINGNYAIAEDGTIKRPYSELDTAMLNIIRVGANKDDILAAYKARKKCYQLCKERAKRPDYKEYVETLQLDNFPNELKKADYGKKYVNLIKWLMIPVIIIALGCLLFGITNLYFWIDDNDIGCMPAGVWFTLFSFIPLFSLKYIVRRLNTIVQSIKSIK